jgi:hypothetical protein
MAVLASISVAIIFLVWCLVQFVVEERRRKSQKKHMKPLDRATPQNSQTTPRNDNAATA